MLLSIVRLYCCRSYCSNILKLTNYYLVGSANNKYSLHILFLFCNILNGKLLICLADPFQTQANDIMGNGKWDVNGTHGSSHKGSCRAPVNLCQYPLRGVGTAWKKAGWHLGDVFLLLRKSVATMNTSNSHWLFWILHLNRTLFGEVIQQINPLRQNK